MLYNNELEKEVIIMQIEIDTKEEIVISFSKRRRISNEITSLLYNRKKL